MANFLTDIELQLIPVVIGMETTGFKVDKEKLCILKAELLLTMAEIEGLYPGVNLNSPKQLREYMIKQGHSESLSTYVTYNQVPSMDKLSLKRLLNKIPMCKDVLKYREVSKLLSTYVEPMLLKDYWAGNFNQVGTITGRFSSSKPNLQQIPVRTMLGKRVRECLTARPGKALIISDMSQIEPRLYAFFSQDTKLLNIYKTGGDFHTAVTKTIYTLNGTPPTKEQRFVGKTCGLATLYGSGTAGLSETLIKNDVFLPDSDVNNIRNKIKYGYKDAIDWYWSYKNKAIKDGHIKTLLGRSIPMVRGMNPVNTKIQGSCADMIKVCMLNIHRAGYTIIVTAHDEVVVEVDDYLAGEASREISAIMEQSILLRGMPLKAETSIGLNWGDK